MPGNHQNVQTKIRWSWMKVISYDERGCPIWKPDNWEKPKTEAKVEVKEEPKPKAKKIKKVRKKVKKK